MLHALLLSVYHHAVTATAADPRLTLTSCHTLVQEGGKASGQVRVSIAPNPSHLEFIGPVVLGMVRAEQTRLQDTAKQRVMGLLIHGDAAFAGLGVVAETLQLADTPGQPRTHSETAKLYFRSI